MIRLAYLSFFSAAISFLVTFVYINRDSELYGYDLDKLYVDAIVLSIRSNDPLVASQVIDEAFSFFNGSKDVYLFSRYLYDSRRFVDGYNSDGGQQ